MGMMTKGRITSVRNAQFVKVKRCCASCEHRIIRKLPDSGRLLMAYSITMLSTKVMPKPTTTAMLCMPSDGADRGTEVQV